MDASREIKIGVVLTLIVLSVGLTTVITTDGSTSDDEETISEFKTFNSSEEFNAYVTTTDNALTSYTTTTTTEVRTATTSEMAGDTAVRADSVAAGDAATESSAGSGGTPRIETRQTNVQESSVGEPDIVKVTQEATFYAQQRIAHDRIAVPEPTGPIEPTVDPSPGTTVSRDYTESGKRERPTRSVKQLSNPNTGNVSVSAELDQADKLLRSDETLLAYNNSEITGYELQDNGASTRQTWDVKINDSHAVQTTRRVDSTAYFVTRERTRSCPVHPLDNRGEIDCNDVYHPEDTVRNVNTMYTVLGVDMETGEVTDEVSFVGTDETTVYMSQDNLYVGYKVIDLGVNDLIDITIETDWLPTDSEAATELRELKDVDISTEAKMIEVQKILEQYGYDDREFTRQVSQNYRNYMQENRRDIFTSTIVSLDVSNGDIEPSAVGSVSGVPLNQFAFDAKDNELRVATTVSPNDRQSSQNDVYVLDDELDVTSSVQGMAEGQRIYAVRFIGDTGYVITYRQVDPLHVIDLSDSDNIEEVGTLKLPGFSEYLHKVGDGKLLGVGESQNGKGKAVLFDVSNPENPTVADSLIINERSTAVSESHRAFMNDDAAANAYIPAGNSLYVVDYDNSELQQEAKVRLDSTATRTRLYNDELLAFSDREVAVINKQDYNVTDTVTLTP